MAIHHAHKKQASEMGITLEEVGDVVRGFHPSTATEWYGADGKTTIKQGYAILNMADKFPDIRYTVDGKAFAGHLRNTVDGTLSMDIGSPQALFELLVERRIDFISEMAVVDDIEETLEMHSPSAGEPGYREPAGNEPAESAGAPEHGAKSGVERDEKGVPVDGAIAYKEGFTAADCPFTSETEDDEEYAKFEKWNDDWDAAADAATDDEENKGGSVVKDAYRARYAELGHPNHCGDWLANLLNNLVQGKSQTDIARFEVICDANGVDLSKYNRTTPGWQGRLRMTGRNLLSKKVYLAGGVIKTPVPGADPEYRAPADWMAAQRFKMPKAEQSNPTPAPAS